MKITRIRVPARYFQEGQLQKKVADFKLGLGPCGKVVTALSVQESVLPDSFVVMQTHEDGSHKWFHYRASDLFGRVEVEDGE